MFEKYYYAFIAFLSIIVFFALQYLTKGIEYFVRKDGSIRYRFLIFVAMLQFFISVLVTWGIVSSFGSEAFEEYEDIKLTVAIVVGCAPFNISILIWVAMKLEVYKLMHKRYGDSFVDETNSIEKANIQESDSNMLFNNEQKDEECKS